MAEDEEEKEEKRAEKWEGKEQGEAVIDLLVRAWLLLPFAIMLGEGSTTLVLLVLGIGLLVFGYIFKFSRAPGAILLVLGGAFYAFGAIVKVTLPTTIYSLANIISVQLLPLSAFPKLETAATWLLWIFIGLMFAGAGWKQMLLMLAIGGVAMGFLSSLGVFAVADSEIAASYNDLVQNTKVKNQTASSVSNVWLMLSNPRLWYEQKYGFKNETLAQGDQTSPFALEITKAAVLETSAPPNVTVTLDIQLKNQGKREAALTRIDVSVEDANLGIYHRYTKADATNPANKDKGWLYFESTDTEQAHYSFCDNPSFVPKDGKISEGFTNDSSVHANKSFEAEKGKFEPGMLDEYFVELTSPACYGRQRVNATVTYGYNVTSTYNLELINSGYFTELAKYNKLKFHTENSKSTEGPLKLTIRSVPEEQPVRLREGDRITVFYSISNVGPGTAIIENSTDIFLEDIDKDLEIQEDCNFVKNSNHQIRGGAEPKFMLEPRPNAGISCHFGSSDKCITLPPDDPDKIVLLKCSFAYKGTVDTTKTLFMKMHVKYDYLTTRKAQYETFAMSGYHPCVTKRELDGFPNKTMMDLYLKELFKDVTNKNTENKPIPGIFSTIPSTYLDAGTGVAPANLCPI